MDHFWRRFPYLSKQAQLACDRVCRRFPRVSEQAKLAYDKIRHRFPRAAKCWLAKLRYKNILSWLSRRFPHVKRVYWHVFSGVLVFEVCLVVLYLVLCWLVEAEPRAFANTLDFAVQASVALAVAVTAVIALANADPARLQISIEQSDDAYLQTDPKDEVNGHEDKFVQSGIDEDCRGPFKNWPDIFYSYRVGFDLINKSGFTLKKPWITVAVPADRSHPMDRKAKDWRPTFHFQFGSGLTIGGGSGFLIEDRFLIRAKLADDWAREAKMPFWVRMVLDTLDDEPFDLHVTIACDDAEGAILDVPVAPRDLPARAGAVESTPSPGR